MSPEGTAELIPGLRPTSVDLFGVFFSNLPQNRHPERSASQIYRVRHRLGAESKDLGGAYLTRAVGTLSTAEARTWRTRHGSKILHRLGHGR